MEAKTKKAEVKTPAPKKEIKKPAAKSAVKAEKPAAKAVKPAAVKKPAAEKPVKAAKPVKAETADDRNNRKTRVGVVVSNRMQKTIVVAIENNIRHPIYKKIVKKTKKFKVHDELNECKIGDVVEIAETRHLSRDKYFRLVRIIERAK